MSWYNKLKKNIKNVFLKKIILKKIYAHIIKYTRHVFDFLVVKHDFIVRGHSSPKPQVHS
jgi:hypothetical protein